MPIPWLTVLKVVPWGEVISNAPKVAEGARKLWGSVAKKPAPPPESAGAANLQPLHDDGSSEALRARVTALETATAELHGQMLTSSELLGALAEQNAQLVKGIEAHGARLRRIVVAGIVGWIAAALVLVWALLR